MHFQLRRARVVLAALAATLPFAVAVGAAQAHEGGGWPGFGGQPRVVVAGTIVSVDPVSNSFVADAYIADRPQTPPKPPGPPEGGAPPDEPGGFQGGQAPHDTSGGEPATTRVTITIDPNHTKFRVKDRDGSLSDLAAGERFYAVFNGDASEDITTLVNNNPPIGVMAYAPPKPEQPRVVVAGAVVSVDPASNSFVADAYIAGEPRGEPKPPGGFHGADVRHDDKGRHEPVTTRVTITIDPNHTKFRVNGKAGSLSDLAAGYRFIALFHGDSSEDITTLVHDNPPIGVMANSPPKPKQLYAFVGTVTAGDTTRGTVTVNVTNSLPAGLVPASANPATFTVGGDTLILGGSSTSGLSWGSLSNVAVGDVVAGGEIGPSGETLAQVEATQLRLLLDFPVASATHAVKANAKAQALAKAKSLLGFKDPRKKHKPKRHKPKSHK